MCALRSCGFRKASERVSCVRRPSDPQTCTGSLRWVPSDGSVQHLVNGLAVADGHLVLASTIDELIRVGAINYHTQFFLSLHLYMSRKTTLAEGRHILDHGRSLSSSASSDKSLSASMSLELLVRLPCHHVESLNVERVSELLRFICRYGLL